MTPTAAESGVSPRRSARPVRVPFFAESTCAGPGTGACSVRIVAINIASGAVIELNPQSGVDYAFDSDMAGAANDLA